jgi:hypothetical protein
MAAFCHVLRPMAPLWHRHLAHIFAKLGVSTRAQLAAQAAHQHAR